LASWLPGIFPGDFARADWTDSTDWNLAGRYRMLGTNRRTQMAAKKHIIRYAIYAAIIAALTLLAGLTTVPLLVAFLTRFAVLCLDTAIGVTIFDILDHTMFGGFNTSEELQKGNLAVAIYATIMIALFVVCLVFGF